MAGVRAGWMLCLAFAVGVIVVSAIMMPMFPKTGGDYPPGIGEPVFAFEMVQSAEDLVGVCGAEDDPDRPARMTAMDQGNRWDYAFMLVYGGYVCSFFLAARRASGNSIWLLPATLGVVAPLSDAIENAILLGLTADPVAAPNVQYLGYFVWCKFICLMFCGIAAGWHVIGTGSIGWRIAGNLMIAGSLTVAAAFIATETWGGIIGQGLAVVWVVQLIYVTVRVAKPGPLNSSQV